MDNAISEPPKQKLRPAKRITNLQLLDKKIKEIEALPIEDKEDVLLCFAQFMSFEAIRHHVIMTVGEGTPFTDVNMIERFCKDPKNKWTIMDMRNRYLNEQRKVAIFHKRVRLDDLQYLRDRYLVQIRLIGDETEKERQEFKYMAYGLADILSKARDEVEGKGMSINVGLGVFDMGDLEGKSDAELISRREELLRKASRAIGVVSGSGASRPGIGDITGRGAGGDNGDSKDVIETTAVESS